MEDYRLEQSGQEVQNILNGAAMQTDLKAENERAELAEQTLQGNIDAEALARENADIELQGHIDDEETRAKAAIDDEALARENADIELQGHIDDEETRAKAAEKQNADDIDAIEEKIPTQASSSNQLADKDYVEDLVSTSSATFRGTFNLVSDLHLTVDASYTNIAAALGNAIAGADNNDFAFVMIPTSVDTPNEIARIEKYKFNGSVWGFEYVLNNSGFTAAQWAAINSGITSALVTKLGALPSAADLAAALLAKQDKLTFDQAPTPSSTNPVTSGGVYTAIDDEKGARVNADAALQQSTEAILLLIPSEATALNQLADKAFVNSSIATDTATFRGTFNLVSDLQLTVDATHTDIAAALLNAISTADNNDYVFVQIPTSVDTPTEIRVTERYKFNGTSWQYEYDLNNSGFTAAQWEAINSGITTLLVTKLSDLPNATELATLFAGKQNVLTFDNAPVSGSDNPVKSGGLYDLFAAIDAKMPTGASANNKLVAEDRLAAYVGGIIGALDATFDLTSADGHVTLRMTQTDGVITSLQILTSDIASASALATLGGQVSTNADDIAALKALYNALQQSAPQVIEPTDTWPVASPSDTVIYRVVDRVNTQPQYYSDYMWNGTSMVLMATYNNAIDPRPKKASQNLVTSGGVFDNMGALDVSELNATENPHTLAKYVDLSDALAAVPIDYQKGGMSIKFVQSSDNKYIQARLMANEFTTDVTKWQGVDDEPTAGSENLVKSNSIFNDKSAIEGLGVKIVDLEWNRNQLISSSNGTIVNVADDYFMTTNRIPVTAGEYLYIGNAPSTSFLSIAGYASDDDASFVSTFTPSREVHDGSMMTVTIPTGVNYVRISNDFRYAKFPGLWKIKNSGILPSTMKWSEARMVFESELSLNLSANILNPDKISSNKYIDKRGVVQNIEGSISVYDELIPVKEGESITLFRAVSSSVEILTFAAFDKNMKFVRGITGTNVYTQQNGEAYVKLGIGAVLDSYPTAFANMGSTLLSYAPYNDLKIAINENNAEVQGKLDKIFGANLIDMSKVTPKSYIYTDGRVFELDDNRYFVSDFIPANEQDICTNAYNSLSGAIRGFAVYGADKSTVVRVGGNAECDYIYQSGDVYVRFTFYSARFNAQYPTAFASYGSTIAAYIPYTDYAPVTELSMELDKRVPPKETSTPVYPNHVYSICDDVENNSLALYADHFVDLSREHHEVLIKQTGTDKFDIYAPISEDGATLNGGVNKKETNIAFTLNGDINDVNVSLVHRSILNTYTANNKIRVLCIGDSVTNGTGSDFPKEVTNNSKYTYWRLMQMLCLRDKKNHNNTGYDFLSIGKQSSITYTYDNVQHKVYAEGRGGWAISNYLYDSELYNVPNLFYDGSKTWTGDYATELNAAGVKFSLASYLAKYKTLDDDGVTRLVPGSTAGTEIVDATECDVCTPNVIVLQLTHNNGGNTDFYKDDMPLMVKAIKNEFPNIPIILSAFDETGCYNSQLYPQVNAKEAAYASLHTQIVKVTGEIKTIVSAMSNVWYCPCNFIQPTALSMTTRKVNRAESLVVDNSMFNFGAEFGPGASFHPSAFANAAWAYEMLACIKWVLSEQN